MKNIEPDHPLGSASRMALRHHVVQRLLIKIIRGEYGPGTRLIANGLAFQLGVSATPVREALVELEQSGVIELLHHRGAMVRAFGREELRDFYQVRRLLQCEAVRLACGEVGQQLLDLLHSELQRLDIDPGEAGHLLSDIFAMDQHIRQMINEHCRNKWLVAELGHFDSLEGALREIAGSRRTCRAEVYKPIAELVAALRNNLPNDCVEAMHRHIGVVAAAVEEIVFAGRS